MTWTPTNSHPAVALTEAEEACHPATCMTNSHQQVDSALHPFWEFSIYAYIL